MSKNLDTLIINIKGTESLEVKKQKLSSNIGSYCDVRTYSLDFTNDPCTCDNEIFILSKDTRENFCIICIRCGYDYYLRLDSMETYKFYIFPTFLI